MSDLVRCKPSSRKKKLNLITPIPPSINHIYYNTKYGGKRLTKDAERWVTQVRSSVHAQIEDQKWKKEALGVWMVFDMTFYFPDKRIRDNHNAFKILFDALEGIVYVNDYYVLPRVTACYLDRENPRLEISIYPQKFLEI